MEGGGYRRRWDKKTSLGTALLLMCIIPASCLSPCQHSEYLIEDQICCKKCFPGDRVVKDCDNLGNSTKCAPCPPGKYIDTINYARNCRGCKSCKKLEDLVSKCERHQDTICRCKKGYYKSNIDSVAYDCRRCQSCGQDEIVKQNCTSETNTVCECKENFHRVNKNCEPCTDCTAGCVHLCSIAAANNTKAPCPGKEYLLSLICGVVAVALVLLLLVGIVTYTVTKRSVQKKLLRSLSQPSDASPDSCEQVLIQDQEPLNNLTFKAVLSSPVTEFELPPKLPDCVPLEVKIPELIYKVLDLVPVLQMKQLVRSLGVKDTEIEQAELDYRSCREAHYQMLRIWAERGLRAGGLLQQSFLQGLLDELRKMHLENAAEELETNYGFQ